MGAVQEEHRECVRIYDLRQKEVINMATCRKLGCVCDVEINLCTGCVTALIVPGRAHICGFLGRESEYVIPFCRVKQIGRDIILVDVCEEEVLVKCKF